MELAARPELLIFLDEPTSGLDSDTAWSICRLLRNLANSGQAILCTIHQPSGMVFEMFDKLLVLSEGKQVYFGDIGPRSRTLTGYFERGGASPCGSDQNPAEWLLNSLHCRAIHWATVWTNSPENQQTLGDISNMKAHLAPLTDGEDTPQELATAFAVPFMEQLRIVTKRALLHDWRTPSFLWSKTLTTFFVVSPFPYQPDPSPLSNINPSNRLSSMGSQSGSPQTVFRVCRTSSSLCSSSSRSSQPTRSSLSSASSRSGHCTKLVSGLPGPLAGKSSYSPPCSPISLDRHAWRLSHSCHGTTLSAGTVTVQREVQQRELVLHSSLYGYSCFGRNHFLN